MRSILTALEENLSWNFNDDLMKVAKNHQVDKSFPVNLSSNSMLKEVLEVKIMLLQLKTIIELASNDTRDSNKQVKQLQLQISEKDEKIRNLESMLATIPRRRQSKTESKDGVVTRHCNHVWGPCANDHSHHHARRADTDPRHRRRSQTRSLSLSSGARRISR